MAGEHAQDVITGMAWAISTLGGVLVLLAAWGGRKVLDRLDSIERLLASENGKLREMIHDIDKRVLTIEGHCSLFHGRQGGPGRRHDDDQRPVAFPDYPD